LVIGGEQFDGLHAGQSATVDLMIDIPAIVRSKAVASGAHEWLDRLPELVASIEHDWGLKVGRVYPDGTEALVTEAQLHDGTDAVLKLMIDRAGDHARHEITVLRLANGEGCAQLLRYDEGRGALLLERLGRSLHELHLPIEARHEILCATASRLWRPAPNCGLPTGAWKGRWLIDEIVAMWEQLDRPCSEKAIDYAVRCANNRIAAHDDERSVLVHGDVHEWNVLESMSSTAATRYKLVDPDGLLAEPEYDLGIIMREDPVELRTADPQQRARWLAKRCNLDATAIWEWGVVERVSTGLLCSKIGLQPVGQEMLATADFVSP
jgi:streptomycin 6-kinase